MAFLNVVKLQEAVRQMQLRFPQHDCYTETVELQDFLGRYLAKDIYADENLPSFRRSMVDGYAVLSADILGASEHSPIVLRDAGKVEMGKKSNISVTSGCAVYVPTGGEVPQGADATVMTEYTEAIGPDIAIYYTAAYKENIVDVGEDVLQKSLVLSKGTQLAPQHSAILASLGYFTIDVVKKPRVFILSTGDELVEIYDTPKYGQVRDCNRTIIQTVAQSCGCEIVNSLKISDNMEKLQNALINAVSSSDVVILSGSSSAGIKDMAQKAIDSLSGNTDSPNVFIHGLAVKPGKPTIIGQVNNKPVICLPGHPAACFLTMKALVEPFLNYLVGKKETEIRSVPCISNFQLHAAGGRDVYQLVELVIKDGLTTANILHGKSGMVSAMAKANAYVVIPMNNEGVKTGDQLMAYLL
jgi:molybdopterin molybdotransferase